MELPKPVLGSAELLIPVPGPLIPTGVLLGMGLETSVPGELLGTALEIPVPGPLIPARVLDGTGIEETPVPGPLTPAGILLGRALETRDPGLLTTGTLLVGATVDAPGMEEVVTGRVSGVPVLLMPTRPLLGPSPPVDNITPLPLDRMGKKVPPGTGKGGREL